MELDTVAEGQHNLGRAGDLPFLCEGEIFARD
jgi:hypothetical protein